MKQVLVFIIFGLLLGSCESSQQMQGLFMGSSLGGLFGSSIGGLMEGPRGADAGRALGMLIGGAAGAAVTAPKHSKDRDEDAGSSYYYNEGSDAPSPVSTTVPAGYDQLKIENLRYIDQNDNHMIDAAERARLIFEIHNTGNITLHNVAPVVSCSMPKRIMISPTAIIASISPGKSVRYTAEVYGKKNLRTDKVHFSISFASGNVLYTVRRFDLNTKGR